MASTPLDVVVRVAELLADDRACATLGALALTSRDTYRAIVPILYANFVVRPGDLSILDLRAEDVEGFNGFDTDGHAGAWGSNARPNALRRIAALSHVRKIIVAAVPRPSDMKQFAAAASTLPPGQLMPRLQSVCIEPKAADELRMPGLLPTGIIESSAFMYALSLQRPRYLCVAFRHVPTADWDAYRSVATVGQWSLPSRLLQLAKNWDLESAAFHDIVSQVLPSLPTRNVYDFAPHAVPIGPDEYEFPRGRDATRLPGPDWNVRPWQMGTAAKALFPSSESVDARRKTLERTTWEICDAENHIMSKEARDDDDTTGVWYAEIKEMIEDSFRIGVARDLPARGLDSAFVDDLLTRVSYRNAGVCDACGRKLTTDVTADPRRLERSHFPHRFKHRRRKGDPMPLLSVDL